MPATARVRALVLGACVALFACSDDSAPGAATPATIELHQSGRWFVDASGRVVTLHGVNITYPQFGTADDLAARYADDAQFLAAQGLDVVRLAIFLSGLVPHPGTYDARYLDGVAALVDTLTGAGLYVLIDVHQDLYANRYYGRGMPDWMAVDDGVPLQPDTGNLFANYALGLAVQRAFDNFWSDLPGPDGVPLQTTYGRALQQIARRFRDRPAVLGYEIMNEPFPGTQFATCASPAGCPLFDGASLTPFYRKVATMLREVDPRKLIAYEPNVTFDFGANTWLGDIGDANAALSFHDYCLGNQFGDVPVDDSLPCEQAGERPQFGYALAHADRHAKALLLTEFGHFTGAESTDTSPVVRRMARIADDYLVSWAYWHYDGVSAYTLVKDANTSPAGDNLYPAIVDAVTRVYPRAIAGTPIAWSYDPPSREFTLEYSTARADGAGRAEGVSEIVVPARMFPAGYAVAVENGRVDGEARGAMVRIVAAATADAVRVRIGSRN
jgi:endoglycosylceramidase